MLRFLTGVFLFGCIALSGQDSVHLASISGRVLDPSGALIEGAAVSAKQVETNLVRETITDRDGRFRLPYLRIGRWEIVVSKQGFADASRTLPLTAGAAFELTFPLSVTTEAVQIEVTASAAVLESARSQIAGKVGETEASALPLNGRSFLDLALLIPGVSPTNTGSNQLFAETSAVPGQGVSVASQRNFSNNFIVDGLSANDDAAGLSGVFFGLDTVQEFQVVTSGGQAELGRALGGFVNVVTRSGSNTHHGSLYGFFRNQRFNAANALASTRLPVTQTQHGLTVGGPAVRDRTFYFGNFEQRLLNQSGLVTISPANVAAINSRLDAARYPGARITTGIYPNPVHMHNALGKLDHSFGSRDQFSVRYSLYDVNSRNSRGAGALNATTASSGLDNRDQTIAIGNILTLSPHTVNETRGQFTRSTLVAEPSDPSGPAISIAGVATLGRLSSSPTGRKNNLFEAVNNLSHQAGSHSFRAGVHFLYNDTYILFPRAARGSYTFSSLANFQQGVYNNAGFTQTFGNSEVMLSNPNLGVYVQDEWKVLPSLTLNAGLRYDLQTLTAVSTDRNNVSPRAGFAWSPGNSARTVIRGGFGLYYDRVPMRALANALLSSNNTTVLTPSSQISLSLAPAQAGAPVFPNILTSAPSGILVNYTTMDPNMQNARSLQGSIEVERRIGRAGTVSVGYHSLNGSGLIVSINQNVPTCAAAGNNNGCRPNAAYANNSQYRPQAESRYDGLHVSYVQSPSRWSQFRLSYTYSKSTNNVGEFFFSSPIDPANLWRDHGRSDDDQRHRLVLNGTLHLPYRIEWSGFLQYYSSLPFNITTGATTVQGTTGRPIMNGDYIERNAGRGADFFNMNVRLSRIFRFTERWNLEVMAEAFNALNHRNDLARNGVFGGGAYPSNPSPTFGQITAVHDPRSLQFALRLRY